MFARRHEWYALFCGNSRVRANFADYLETGESIDECLERFPTVTWQQVLAFLKSPHGGSG